MFHRRYGPTVLLLYFSHFILLLPWSIFNKIAVLRKFSTRPRTNATDSHLIPWEISMEDRECWPVHWHTIMLLSKIFSLKNYSIPGYENSLLRIIYFFPSCHFSLTNNPLQPIFQLSVLVKSVYSNFLRF